MPTTKVNIAGRDEAVYRCSLDTVEQLTVDTWQYVVDRPDGFQFEPGQAVDISLDQDQWRGEAHPFTITSHPKDPKLQFTIKSYEERDGVTKRLKELRRGDTILISPPWGAITWHGPGVFIAGGAGITPFIAIFRQQHEAGNLTDCQLLYSCGRVREVILRAEIERMFGDRALLILSEERADGYRHGHIDEELLRHRIDNLDQKFYICGPPEMVEETKKLLIKIGASESHLIVEEFHQ